LNLDFVLIFAVEFGTFFATNHATFVDKIPGFITLLYTILYYNIMHGFMARLKGYFTSLKYMIYK
jgi:hypothetical protein